MSDTAFTFAHLSDPHLPLPPGPPPLRLLANKRLLGFLSFWRERRHLHLPSLLAALTEDVARHHPDHIVVTGDLVNIALPEEFEQARLWLQTLGRPEAVSVVPGNHDATVAVPWATGLGRWRPWMEGDDGGDGFPYVRLRGPVAFVGVSTAVPSAPLLAIGRVGGEQAARLEEILAALGRDGLFRVVLMHHPPVMTSGGRRKALADRAEVRAVLSRAGAELVLHGHHHRTQLAHLRAASGTPIPVIGAGSASRTAERGEGARWIRFAVSGSRARGWRLAAELRSRAEAGFSSYGRMTLAYRG